jgi:hypothetical protein
MPPPPLNNQPLQHTLGTSPNSNLVSPLRWWYHLSTPPEVPENASFLTREQFRRGRVASLIILGTLCAAMLLVPIILFAAPSMFLLSWALASAGAGLLCCLIAIPLNHRGHIRITAILLLVAVDVIVAGIVLSEQAGLDPLFLSMFDLLVVSELIAASLLAPASVFGVALINIVLIVLDINLQPRSMMWMQMVLSQQLAYSLLARPITLYVVVAAVAYLWVRSALTALQRADRAEIIAELQRRENEQRQRLAQEIEQILMTHVRVANGDLNARAPTYQDNVLWQIGIALNNLLSRFKSSLQAERNLQRVAGEIAQLRIALRNWESGQPLQWYPSREMLLNPLVADLRRVLTTVPARNALSSPMPSYSLQERQRGKSPSLPGPVSSRQRLPGESGTRSSATRLGDVARDTPLPDNSGFLAGGDVGISRSSNTRAYPDQA